MRLRSYGRSTFASLTAEDGSYIQVGGGGVGCVLERRGMDGDMQRAYLTTPAVPFEDGTELVLGAGRVRLRSDEWINIRIVVEEFVAFLRGDEISPRVQWRDHSEVMDIEGGVDRVPQGSGKRGLIFPENMTETFFVSALTQAQGGEPTYQVELLDGEGRGWAFAHFQRETSLVVEGVAIPAAVLEAARRQTPGQGDYVNLNGESVRRF